MPKRRRIKVIFTKLGRQKVWGMADSEIEIDVRTKGKKLLEILNHEALHVIFPSLEEDEIIKASIELTNLLWSLGFRRCDLDNSIELQDGKK